MQAVILAGGLGTRLGALTRRTPKSMIEVAGVPYLEHQLRLLARQSFHDVLLLTGYLGDRIENYFGDGSGLNLRLRYVREDQPLGTGGALRDARSHLAESFLLLYGDSLLPIEYAAARRLRDSAALGLIVVYRDPAGETGVPPNVALDRSGLVIRYDKTAPADSDLEYVEAGVSCFRREVLDLLPATGPASFEECCFPRLIERRQLAALPTSQRFYDIGTPPRLRAIEDYLRVGGDSPPPPDTQYPAPSTSISVKPRNNATFRPSL
jgi:NDP-sugar pyrophosphorylase family protein